MNKFISTTCFLLFAVTIAFSQTDSLVLKDIEWDPASPAGQTELFIPSAGSQLAGFIYRANGAQKHPTLLLLHGYPGNERNLDLAQVARARGWNVIYFDYRGSWGSPGNFSFKNCVEDVANVVEFCKKYQDSLKIDTSNIVLFGHSMGGFVCLKALQQIPGIKKGFALSTWDIYKGLSKIKSEKALQDMVNNPAFGMKYFVLNASLTDIFMPVLKDPDYFNLSGTSARNALAGKQIIMLDEHTGNKELAEQLKASNKNYFDYQVWKTDHPFTNKRVALIKMALAFLAR
ncbi:MAG: alpha/beta fold hydrolase [Bacteroidetes bacterium]|nr:alpha/beta fold hydrolase [Bacteroidota bacterium]